MQKRNALVALAACVIVLLVLSGPAQAATTNAFDLTYAGQSVCAACHSGNNSVGVAPAYIDTAHGRMVTDVQANPSAVIPAADSGLWPSPGPGIQFGPSDLFLVVGGAAGKEYVGLPKGGGGTSAGGQEIPTVSPADDYPLFDPMGFDAETNEWMGEDEEVGVAAYFQRCAGCHNLGLTRPSAGPVTLANGAEIRPDTPTAWAGLSIQCENCHGTGSAENGHMGSGAGIVGMPSILSSEVCGQCHATGTTTEKRLGSSSSFSNPNGYTTDEPLADYFKVADPIGNPDRFYPDGHNRNMNHVYFNEWRITEHADSRAALKDEAGDPLPFAQDECMRCHSAEGYLAANGYESSYFDDHEPSPATDEYDIECAVCHTVHDGSNPDGALGLRTERDEVCSQCHNGEIEEGESLEPGAAVHHPQKEMFEGYGLIDVAEAEPSMGDATCVDCHMPVTRSGRYSHRFTPMLPGNAEEWGVREGGDSCTTCHPTMSRSTLQGNIDGWQAETKADIAEVKALLAAAPERSGALGVFDAAMADRATSDMSFVEQDGSFGVHNISYARAGLAKATYFAKAVGSTIEADFPSSAAAGSDITISGSLTFGDGSTKAGETVAIQKQVIGWTDAVTVTTVTTDSEGEFSVTIRPGATGDYAAVWQPSPGVELSTTDARITVDMGAPEFTDVPIGSTFYGPIQGLACMGVVGGVSEGVYAPDRLLKRAQAAKMLVIAFGFADSSWTNWGDPSFSDVPQPAAQSDADRYPFDYVEKAKENGVVQGVTADLFMPWDNVTRAQLALMIVRIGGDDLDEPAPGATLPFTDLGGLSAEASHAIAVAYANGLIDGTSATTFAPTATATRGQAAKMIWNLATVMGHVQ